MTTKTNRRMQFAKKAFIALLLPVLTWAVAQKTYSQQPAPAAQPEKQTTGTQAVSAEAMREFFATIEHHTKYVKNKKGRVDPVVTMAPELENELYAIYERMNPAQKAAVKAKDLVIFRMDMPVKKAPSPEVFENWKRPEVFGIWINEKHVPNSELNKYKYSDIAEYNLSKLYGAALKGRSYKYQLDLTTNDYFDKTYDERVKNRVLITRMVTFVPKEPSKKGK